MHCCPAYQHRSFIEVLPPHALYVPFNTHVLHTLYISYRACSLQHPRFTYLIHVIHCVFPSTPTFYTPATCHTLRVPFDNHVLYTCYMSYTACSLQHPRFTHLIHSLLVSSQRPSAGSDIVSSSVVTGEDDEKVVQNIQLLQGCDDLAHAFVHSLHHPTVSPADICCVELLAQRVLFVLWGNLNKMNTRYLWRPMS